MIQDRRRRAFLFRCTNPEALACYFPDLTVQMNPLIIYPHAENKTAELPCRKSFVTDILCPAGQRLHPLDCRIKLRKSGIVTVGMKAGFAP